MSRPASDPDCDRGIGSVLGLVAVLVAVGGLVATGSAGGPDPAGSAPGAGSDSGGPLEGPVDGEAATGRPLHGNHVTVEPQVVGDGRVVVESAALLADGFVAIHRVRDGERGELVGHAPLGIGIHTEIPVEIGAGRLPAGGNVTLRATLYADDGDGEFDEEDAPLRAFGSVATDEFGVRVGDATVRVVAADLQLRRSNGSVTVDRVDLARPGYVVVHVDRGLTLGDVVGTRALSAGTHRNVSVELDPTLFAEEGERLDLRAVAYAGDGDGSFDDGDRPVRVGDAPVSARLSVLTAAGANGTTTALVNTPEPTTVAGGSTTATTTASESDDGTPRNGSPGDGDGTGDGDGGLPLSGFGIVVAALAVVGYLIWRQR